MDELDTKQEAQEQDTDESPDTKQEARGSNQDQDKPDKPFTPEQEQYIGSWMGRIISKQFEEKVLPVIQQAGDNYSSPSPSNDNAIDEFNQKLHDMVLEGNVTGALELYNNVAQKAKEKLTHANKIQTDRALTSFSDQPYYKDVFNDAQKIAHDMVRKGYPPDIAADYAYTKAEAKFLKKKSNQSSTPQDMVGGGKRKQQSKEVKLPPQFRNAFERDKKRGLFKDEEEYINHLSPEIRAKYGL